MKSRGTAAKIRLPTSRWSSNPVSHALSARPTHTIQPSSLALSLASFQARARKFDLRNSIARCAMHGAGAWAVANV
jgi:hypothetical protein